MKCARYDGLYRGSTSQHLYQYSSKCPETQNFDNFDATSIKVLSMQHSSDEQIELALLQLVSIPTQLETFRQMSYGIFFQSFNRRIKLRKQQTNCKMIHYENSQIHGKASMVKNSRNVSRLQSTSAQWSTTLALLYYEFKYRSHHICDNSFYYMLPYIAYRFS